MKQPKPSKTFHSCLTAVLTAGLLSLGRFRFARSYLRLWESLADLAESFRFYFRTLFGMEPAAVPSVAKYSVVMEWDLFLPADFQAFRRGAVLYFRTLFRKERFLAWLSDVGSRAAGAAKIVTVLLPCVFAVVLLVRRMYARGNTRHNRDTLPLRVFKAASGKTYRPAKRFLCGYLAFLRAHPWIWSLWLVIWAFHLNLASVAAETLAYYFFFAVSFRVDTLYVQFVKLVLDLQPFFRFFPWWSLVLFIYPLFARFRARIALARLRRMEARNCGFINELPIVSVTYGSMGKRKTTMITDMALSQEVMFRQRALAILQTADMKFPCFPWICFEKELLTCMEHGTVWNLATVKTWVRLKQARYEKHGNRNLQLYGYDAGRYGLTHDNGLTEIPLFDVLETYAQAYFIYVAETSLLVANYAIRTDNNLHSAGNFPAWALDFFPEKKRKSRRSHILDFDILRLGRKMLEHNPRAGSFEFGVVVITEIGKERGNNLELKEVRKQNDETNQKNDLFNSWLKMCRHSATVDCFPFIKVFTDEQRPESWGADARDLCDIVRIVSAGEEKLALPFCTVEQALSEWAYSRFLALYYDFRYRRGDNTLLVHLLKAVTAWLRNRDQRIWNRYGYSILKIEKERGTMDGKPENKRYYLMNRKIYSNRFSTDCFSDYFNDMAKKSKVGLAEYPEYETEKASVEELKMQNSYFIRSLYRDNGEDSAD